MSEVSGGDVPVEAVVESERGAPGGGGSYEPPRLRVIGSFVELTRGSSTTLSDGLGSGSALG